MAAQPVDATATTQRISRTVQAVMAARGVTDNKALAQMSGLKYDTLLRRLNGKPWLAHELLAVAAALEVDVQVLLATDPDGWFPRAAVPVAVGAAPSQRVTPAPKKSGTRRNMVYCSTVSASTVRLAPAA